MPISNTVDSSSVVSSNQLRVRTLNLNSLEHPDQPSLNKPYSVKRIGCRHYQYLSLVTAMSKTKGQISRLQLFLRRLKNPVEQKPVKSKM